MEGSYVGLQNICPTKVLSTGLWKITIIKITNNRSLRWKLKLIFFIVTLNPFTFLSIYKHKTTTDSKPFTWILLSWILVSATITVFFTIHTTLVSRRKKSSYRTYNTLYYGIAIQTMDVSNHKTDHRTCT